MADTTTTHIGLIKQDPNSKPDYVKDDSNLDTLDAEIWKRGKKFNGQDVDSNGEFNIRMIPYAENLETSSGQKSDEEFIIRTSGGEASINDGDAWLMLFKGNYTHTGFVAQEVNMTVTPMERTPDPDITATLDEATFEAYVGEAGTYTITYTTEWSTSPTLYGLTVSNTPIEGDSITMDWDGESNAEVTVNAAIRPTPESISATIDEDTFVSYVENSGTTTLTYSTGWSADPANYGITVTGTPIAGDVITVVYVKEVRGTITQSNPQKFISTGWNLYDHANTRARVLKYSSEQGYGFKISGTYTALEFATTTTGSRTTITPVSGYFAVPSDGWVFVTGGNATDTQIWMTWSDWGTTANGGTFAPYAEYEVDFSTFMAENFPYGLMAVGTVQDEINLNIGIATSRVVRLAYNATNLANAKASGRQYEYDENYIYVERESAVTYSVDVDGDYTASDHGMEWYTGTNVAVYTETVYGANLKNKLERDVVTISQQTLDSSQKAQVQTNIGLVPTQATDKTTSGFVADARVIKTLNDQIATQIYSADTLANIQASLVALNGTLADKQQKAISFTLTTPAGGISGTTYIGTIMRFTSTRCVVIAESVSDSNIITGNYNAGTWSWYNNNNTISGKANVFGAGTSNTTSINNAIVTRLTEIGVQASGTPFVFAVKYGSTSSNAVPYFGIACYASSTVCLGRLFASNNINVYSFRYALGDEEATLNTYTLNT